MELQGGVLEVLLVGAEGLKKPHFLGKCDLYVAIQYGDQIRKSKVVQVKRKAARWNEKFKFKITVSDEGHAHKLVLRIMDADDFASTCVGETLIHLGGILTEGNEKGSMEVKAAPYNVVLKDLSYHGVIRVGLKFNAHASWNFDSNDIQTLDPSNKVNNAKADEESFRMLATRSRLSLKALLDFWDVTWRKFYFYKERSSYMLTDASGASKREAAD